MSFQQVFTPQADHTHPGHQRADGSFSEVAPSFAPNAARVHACRGKKFAFDIDLKSCYHQFALPKRLRVWSFISGRSKFRINTIPTGGNWCPAFAHTFTEALALYVASHFPAGAILAQAYIDNIRFASDHLDLLIECVKLFFRIAGELQSTSMSPLTKSWRRTRPTNYVFLGIQYHHGSHTTELSPKMRAKLLRIAGTEVSHFERFSLREAMSFYGLLSAAANVTGSCRGDYYHLTKFFRRSVGRPLDGPANIWKSVRPVFSRWAKDELSRPERVWRDPERPHKTRIVLFTDASLKGYGVVIFADDTTVHIKGGRWTPDILPDHVIELLHPDKAHAASSGIINVLEATALLIGLDFVQRTFTRALSHHLLDVKVRVDNTSVRHRASAGSSKSFRFNDAIRKVPKHPVWESVSDIVYVETTKNHADWLSRYDSDIQGHLHNPLLYFRLKCRLQNPS